VVARLGDAEDATQSIHVRAGAIEIKAENAAADHQGLVTRVNALNQDINAQFVKVNTYIGDVEAKADTNADDIVSMAAKVTSNAGEIDSLQDTATELDGKVAGLESSKATRGELAAAVDDFEDQLQAESADIRVLQDEMQTKVIKLDDQTTEHNSFIKDMQANIASLGGRVDGNDADITELKQTRLTQAQVQDAIDASLTPVKDKLEGDIAKLRTDLNAIDLEPLEKKIELNTIVARIGAGIGPSKTLTETEASKVANEYCASSNQVYDSQKNECVKCISGLIDKDYLRCRESNLVSVPLSKTWCTLE
jgi:chromosome segregation ATPase